MFGEWPSLVETKLVMFVESCLAQLEGSRSAVLLVRISNQVLCQNVVVVVDKMSRGTGQRRDTLNLCGDTTCVKNISIILGLRKDSFLHTKVK